MLAHARLSVEFIFELPHPIIHVEIIAKFVSSQLLL